MGGALSAGRSGSILKISKSKIGKRLETTNRWKSEASGGTQMATEHCVDLHDFKKLRAITAETNDFEA